MTDPSTLVQQERDERTIALLRVLLPLIPALSALDHRLPAPWSAECRAAGRALDRLLDVLADELAQRMHDRLTPATDEFKAVAEGARDAAA